MDLSVKMEQDLFLFPVLSLILCLYRQAFMSVRASNFDHDSLSLFLAKQPSYSFSAGRICDSNLHIFGSFSTAFSHFIDKMMKPSANELRVEMVIRCSFTGVYV